MNPDEDYDMPMDFDLAECLGGLLTNEEGNNIAGILSEVKSSVDKVAQQLEVQNKILMKMLTSLNNRPAA
jgi:hypothetical protein